MADDTEDEEETSPAKPASLKGQEEVAPPAPPAEDEESDDDNRMKNFLRSLVDRYSSFSEEGRMAIVEQSTTTGGSRSEQQRVGFKDS